MDGKREFKILHISDLHWSQPKFSGYDFFSKKFIGMFNMRFNFRRRRSVHVNSLLDRLGGLDWDLLCITGDFTHVGKREELKETFGLLKQLKQRKQGKLMLIPGNHDNYTFSARRKKLFGNELDEINDINLEEFSRFGVLHVLMESRILLSFFETTRPTNHFSSRGKFKAKQLKNIEALPEEYKKAPVKIAFGHYNLSVADGHKQPFLKKLKGSKYLFQMLKEHNYSHYLHGHFHKSWHLKNVHKSGLDLINSAGWTSNDPVEGGCHMLTVKPDDSIKIEKIFPL